MFANYCWKIQENQHFRSTPLLIRVQGPVSRDFQPPMLNQKLNLGPIPSKTVSRIFRFRKDIREIRCRHSRRLHGHGVGV